MNADLDHMRQRVGRIRKCLSLDENNSSLKCRVIMSTHMF
jgi:hypothetical protein